MDAANGRVALTTSASPVMDAGGNVAISPTGRRVAVLADGVIQIFELPAPPPLPSAASPAAAQPSAH
jgi:flagellar basal body rod protein FlgF